MDHNFRLADTRITYSKRKALIIYGDWQPIALFVSTWCTHIPHSRSWTTSEGLHGCV